LLVLFTAVSRCSFNFPIQGLTLLVRLGGPKWMTYDTSPVPYDANMERGPKAVAYDGSAIKNS